MRSNYRLARDTLSQYGVHFCETSYGPDAILLQGHAVTLTFKVATQMLRATRRLNLVIISVK
jgi:hypothetical protein